MSRTAKLALQNTNLRKEIQKLRESLTDINRDRSIQKQIIQKQKKPERSPLESRQKRELLRKQIRDKLEKGIFSPPKITGKVSKTRPRTPIEIPSERRERSPSFQSKRNLKEIQGVLNRMADDSLFGSAVKKELETQQAVDPLTKLIQESPEMDYEPIKESFDSYYQQGDQSIIISNSLIPVDRKITFSSPSQDQIETFTNLQQEIQVNQPKVNFICEQNRREELKRTPQLVCERKSLSQNERNLENQIQALRRENSKLRDKLSSITSKPLPRRPLNRKFRKSRSRSRSKTPQQRLTPIPSKSPKAMNRTSSSKSFDVMGTPRHKHCKHCDVLLSKGFSTIGCSKHGIAKNAI